MEHNGKQVSVLGTIRSYFMPETPLAAAKAELVKLTQTDREELIAGIIKVNGELQYAK
jgi:hypothetical protein